MRVQQHPQTRPFPATDVTTGRYHHNLESLRGRKVSGVYAIIDRRSGTVLYVGESHSGRLYDTITRHFRKWSIPRGQDAQGRRRGGTTYDRNKVSISYTVTPPEGAMDFQFAEIQRLKPRDNFIDGGTVCCDEPPI